MSGSLGAPTALSAYALARGNEPALAAAAARADPTTLALSQHFQKAAGSIASPDALLKDYKALKVVLGAFGVGQLQDQPALLRKLLTEDPASPRSTAYRIGNAKYLAFAKALHDWSLPPFAAQSERDSVVRQFQLAAYETSADAQTPGLRQALYFTRQAGAVKSLTQLQADPDLLRVAVEGVGVPWSGFTQLAFAEQKRVLHAKLNVADLQKPAYVQHLANTYLAQAAIAGTGAQSVKPGTIGALFSGQTASGSDILRLIGGSGGTTQTSGAGSLLSLFT